MLIIFVIMHENKYIYLSNSVTNLVSVSMQFLKVIPCTTFSILKYTNSADFKYII